MRVGAIIAAVFTSQAVSAQELWIPRVETSDFRVLQILDNGSLLVQSDSSSFFCAVEEADEAFVFESCKPILSGFVYAQLQMEAEARIETVRLEGMSAEDIDLATKATLKLAGCSIELGAFDFFSDEALVAFAGGVEVRPELAPFLGAKIETLTRDSLNRIFPKGEVTFHDNRTKISLKDCV